MKVLDIRRVPTEAVLLVWLSRIVEQFDKLVMTKAQNEWLAGRPDGWTTLRGVPIEVKEGQ